MYNQKVIDRLTKLTNLHALKNANVTAMTKKNEFGDVVKFFARINTNNEIESISYKASGCSAFMAVCSYFCELCEGKSIKSALKIKEDDLKKFTDLDEAGSHVYKIILDTFALLIKKYNKGVEKGIITPVEPTEKEKEPAKVETKVAKKSSTAEKKIVETDISDIISTEKKRKSNKITKNLDVQKTKANSIETAKKTEENNANSQKISHIEALNSKLKTKETNEKMKDNSKSLNNMLSFIQKTSSKPAKSKTTKVTKTEKTEPTNEIGTQKVVEKEITVETVVVEDKKAEHAKSASIAFSSLQKTLAGMQKSISTANDNKKADVTSKKAKNAKSTTEKTKNSAKKADEKSLETIDKKSYKTVSSASEDKSKKLEKDTNKLEEKSKKADKKEEKASKNSEKADKKAEKASKKVKTAKNEQKAETPKKERKSIFNWFRKK